MIQIKETIYVKRPIVEVYKFVSDFRFIEQWDPGVVSSVKLTLGKVKPGTEYKLNLRYGIYSLEMIYTITEYDPPSRVVLQGTGKTFKVTDTIIFSETQEGTKIEYTVRLYNRKSGATASKLTKPLLSYIGRKAINGLKKSFDSRVKFPGRIRPIDRLADITIVPGLFGFTKWGYQISKKFWQANPCFLTGKNIVITGATSGIGKKAAFALAELDANLTLIARNRQKAIETKQEIVELTGNKSVDFCVADLSLMTEIVKLSKLLIQNKPIIDVLINNAGALYGNRMETTEGFEKSFATNLLGVFLLTRNLTEPLSNSEHPKIINISSGGMYTEKIDVNDLQNKVPPFNGPKAYARAKRGLVILTEVWAASEQFKNFSIHAMHPGWVDTPGLALSLPRFYTLTKNMLRSPEQGADTISWLASAPEPAMSSGGFWLDRRMHPTHVFKRTQESAQERELLLQKLSELTDNFS